MIYLLDTNTCIGYLKGRSLSIRQKLQTLTPKDVAVCSVVKAELFYGAIKSSNPTQALRQQQDFLNQFVSLPFDDPATLIYAQVRAKLEREGTPSGAYDLQIAAIALVNDLILVTYNTREFCRVEGLKIEDWADRGFGNRSRYNPAEYSGIVVVRLPNRPNLADWRQAMEVLIAGLEQSEVKGRICPQILLEIK